MTPSKFAFGCELLNLRPVIRALFWLCLLAGLTSANEVVHATMSDMD